MAFKQYDIFIIIFWFICTHSIIIFFLLESTQVLWIYWHVLRSFLWNHHQIVSKFRHLESWKPVPQVEFKVFQVGHVCVTTSDKWIHCRMELLHSECVKKYFPFLLSVIPSGHLKSKLFKTVTVCIECFIFNDTKLIFESFWVWLWFLSFVKELPISELQW